MAGEVNGKTYSLPPSTVISRGILPALAPFVASSVGYFYSHLYSDVEEEKKAFLKMAPIFFLTAYCLLYGRKRSLYKVSALFYHMPVPFNVQPSNTAEAIHDLRPSSSSVSGRFRLRSVSD